MQVVFRADASSTLGHGHVMRSLTLANVLRDRGHSAAFVCRELPGNLCALIEERGFAAHRLPESLDSWEEDATRTAAALERPHWLVVDHYGLDSRWESRMRAGVGGVMAIDDMANRPHDCDVILDQNLVAGMHSRYDDKVPPSCTKLLGPRFALLQPAYAQLHASAAPRTGPVRRIFVFFGGADADNLTGRTLAAFLRLQRPDIHMEIVINAASPHANAILEQAKAHSNVSVRSGLSSLAPLMAEADLAIGASGATSWERLCLRLPALVVTLADNQREVAAELDRLKLIRWLGDKPQATSAAIEQALREILASAISPFGTPSGDAAVDGGGAARVCDALEHGPNTSKHEHNG